jgi:hypothetical protein
LEQPGYFSPAERLGSLEVTNPKPLYIFRGIEVLQALGINPLLAAPAEETGENPQFIINGRRLETLLLHPGNVLLEVRGSQLPGNLPDVLGQPTPGEHIISHGNGFEDQLSLEEPVFEGPAPEKQARGGSLQGGSGSASEEESEKNRDMVIFRIGFFYHFLNLAHMI